MSQYKLYDGRQVSEPELYWEFIKAMRLAEAYKVFKSALVDEELFED